MTTPHGVVLDRPLAHALLFAAVKERLVADEPSIGDGFVARLLQRPPDQSLLDTALEQLVLGGSAIVPFALPRQWSGELFESGAVLSTPLLGEAETVEVSGLPSNVVLGMLGARGVAWRETELRERYERFMSAYRAWEQIADGKSFEGLEIRKMLSSITDDALADYSAEQLSAWQTLQNESMALQPVTECVDAYATVISAALKLNALSSVPVISTSLTISDPTPLSEGPERLALLRLTCKALRRVPIARTLRETLEIARSDEAEALRSRLAGWTHASRAQNTDAAELALADVAAARKALASAKRAALVGEYATWIGVPLSVAGAFVVGPMAAIAGITVSAAGALAVGTQKLLQCMNRWAMFGTD